MSQFLMPSLGSDMDAGVLVEQLIGPGEAVKRGDIIGAVETQKGVIEIEVFEDGTLDRWLVDLGTKVPVGTPLAMIRGQGEPEIPEPPPQEVPATPEPTPPPEIPEAPQPVEPPIAPPPQEVPPPSGARLRATPAARRLAAQSGIDLATLTPGPNGVIARAQVLAPGPAPAKTPQLDMRAAIAAAMSRSKREIPHYYLSHEIDLTEAQAFLTETNAGRAPEDRLHMGVLYAKAMAKALGKYTEFNGHFEEGTFQPSEAVHLGFAINLRSGGLVAPAIFDAGDLSPDTLMATMRDLIDRVKAGRFKARELSDATITLTSLGDRGVDNVFGVIYPPQVAIVGIGTPREQPAVHKGQIVPRLIARLTLSADHRVSDGHRGALFLRAIAKHLGNPKKL